MKTLILTPEPPYPLHGGGAYRIASLLHYFAARGPVDLILISETGRPALLPEGLVRRQRVIGLKPNGRDLFSRILRNASRAIRGVPPLFDRMSGLGSAIQAAIGQERYDLALIEHFWCAPYFGHIAPSSDITVLDMHNIESVLHRRSARWGALPVRAAHLRFARASEEFETRLLPLYSHVLATSEADAVTARRIAPGAQITVFPNSFPSVPVPCHTDERLVVFPANFEYDPNIDAVRYLTKEIWPLIQARSPDAILRLVGRGDKHVRRGIRNPDGAIQFSGPVEDSLAEIGRGAVIVAPLRSGSGTRLKIIEAWAAARPIVATTIAAEGLAAVDHQNLIIANTPAEFAAAVTGLLNNPEEAARLGRAGRATYEKSYTWDAAWLNLESLFGTAPTSGLAGYTEIA